MVSDRILQHVQPQKGICIALCLLLCLRVAAFPYGDCLGAPSILQATQLKGPLKDADEDTNLIAFKPFLVFFMKY